MTTATDVNSRSLRVLFLVEGYTDIRYVDGLARICDLTMAIPVRTYESSGLKQRLADCGSPVAVHEIPGGRLGLGARGAELYFSEFTLERTIERLLKPGPMSDGKIHR
jgi:hypothetical protein